MSADLFERLRARKYRQELAEAYASLPALARRVHELSPNAGMANVPLASAMQVIEAYAPSGDPLYSAAIQVNAALQRNADADTFDAVMGRFEGMVQQ